MMAMVKTPNRWLGLLGAVVIWSSASVVASTSPICSEHFFADGDCDESNNNAECGYDFGDCCACTCQDGENFTCGGNVGFYCIDPNAPCVDDDDNTAYFEANGCWVDGIGDGYCRQDNNRKECGYDGGDCCSCTCDPDNDPWGDEACTAFACVDPDAPCVDDDDATMDQIGNCFAVEQIGNGFCELGNNKEECGFDGGDCCECTCQDYPYPCGQYSGFACVDPEAACVDDDPVTVDMLENCPFPTSIGDGFCHIQNNIAACDYDGGDCCECTCDSSRNPWDDRTCFGGMYSSFACVDPDAPCVDEDSVTVEMLDDDLCAAGNIGNGYCDDQNNKPECAYDDGDCCECTCVTHDDGYEFYCQFFACIDPEAACMNDDDITMDQYETCGDLSRIGDGFCDGDNNKEECAFDGGDCCECTCEIPAGASIDTYACNEYYNINNLDCLDTSASCYGEEPIVPTDSSMSYEFISYEFDNFWV